MKRLVLLVFLISYSFATSFAQENKFVPPDGKVLVIIGQNLNDIKSYTRGIDVLPAGFMVYTSIQKMDGLNESAEFESSQQNFSYLVKKYPDTVIQIGLNMVDALDDVILGTYDDNIIKLASWIKGAGCPVYLRIGYEFDRPENNYNPGKYIEAYKYIVDKLGAEGAHNVSYVWHSFAWYADYAYTLLDWYPGDDYVDWFGLSYFQGKTIQMDAMSYLSKEYNKPIMIAEASPHNIGTREGEYSWYRWFKPFFEFVDLKSVKAICYINSNWNTDNTWKEKKWGDARLQVNRYVEKQWINKINEEKYLNSSENLYTILGYEKEK